MIRLFGDAGLVSVRSIRMMATSVGVKRVLRIRRLQTGSILQPIFIGVAPITIAIAPSPLFAFSYNNSTVSGSVTASVTGGAAPFSYNWTTLSHSGAAPSILGATIASPTFIQTGVGLELSETATFRVTVTDSAGQTATADLSAQFFNETFG